MREVPCAGCGRDARCGTTRYLHFRRIVLSATLTLLSLQLPSNLIQFYATPLALACQICLG